MKLEEFESQTRNILEQVLNQLQTATLLVAQLEVQIAEAGQTIRNLSLQVESFTAQQRQQRQIEPEN